MKVDFIIFGQGLAGTLLAYELLIQGKFFLVFKDPDQIKSSDVAAGLINPVVFRRMTKSWLVDKTFFLKGRTLRSLERLLPNQICFPSRILKMLDEDRIDFWEEKAFTNQLTPYLEIEPS